MVVTGGINTGAIDNSFTNQNQLTVPPGTVTATFNAVFIQRNATDTGSVYFDNANIGLLSGPVPPTISAITPNGITLCTNTTLSCTATSTVTTISSMTLVITSTTLGGTTNVTTNTFVANGPDISGLGTNSATLSYPLTANTIYLSVVVSATDADAQTVTSPVDLFDTLAPNLVIEAADFNYSSGLFLDTPANGGFALYQGLVGAGGVDENKNTRTAPVSYYRPADAVVIQDITPEGGIEQKFINTTNPEVGIGFNTPGDWLNYTRTYGAGGSAATGTYDVWCYMSSTGVGVPELALYELTTSNAPSPSQTTNFIGNFGGPNYSDSDFNNYQYVPLQDAFGNRVSITLTNGEQTLKSAVVANPNIAYYILTPVVPFTGPEIVSVYPTAAFQPTNVFSFAVSPAQGSSISTNGIGVVLNGVNISSSLNYTATGGGGWATTYPIQSNQQYTVTISVTNASSLTVIYSETFNTFDIQNNYHWMAADYDFSTNNGTSSGGSAGNGWTGGLFIDNPVPTADTNAPSVGIQGLNLRRTVTLAGP